MIATLLLMVATLLTLISGSENLIKNWKYLDHRK